MRCLSATFCRQAETERANAVREGLLEIVTRAAMAEKEVLVQRLRVEGVRLGTLTVGRAGHMGKAPVPLHNLS